MDILLSICTNLVVGFGYTTISIISLIALGGPNSDHLFSNSWRYIFAIVASWIIIVFSSELFSALLLQLWEPVKTVGYVKK